MIHIVIITFKYLLVIFIEKYREKTTSKIFGKKLKIPRKIMYIITNKKDPIIIRPDNFVSLIFIRVSPSSLF